MNLHHTVLKSVILTNINVLVNCHVTFRRHDTILLKVEASLIKKCRSEIFCVKKKKYGLRDLPCNAYMNDKN